MKFNKNYNIILANNDVLEFSKDVSNESATLIVTSPPYNIGKPYEKLVELQNIYLGKEM